jgi:hypothetical protein
MAKARTPGQWDALSAGNRRRWNAHGGRAYYLSGGSLTRSQRGHAWTPATPGEALDNPTRYPRYVGTHTEQLNEIARRRGLAEHGTGPRGSEVTDYYESGGDFTYTVPDGTLDLRDWRFSQVYRTPEEAQLSARRSGAPAGVVVITDRGPDYLWRYELWFGYPESRGKRHKARGGKMHDRAGTERENTERFRSFHEQREERA